MRKSNHEGLVNVFYDFKVTMISIVALKKLLL